MVTANWERLRLPGVVVGSHPQGVAVQFDQRAPAFGNCGVFIVWHEAQSDLIAVGAFSREAAGVAVFDMLSPFRVFNRRLYKRYAAAFKVFVLEEHKQRAGRAIVTDLSFAGMRLRMPAPLESDHLSVVIQAFGETVEVYCEVLGAIVEDGEFYLRLRYMALNPFQLASLTGILMHLEELDTHGPELLAA